VPEHPLLALRSITKSFGAVKALQDVSLEVQPGEIVGLCGDNGAGKSTLIKIVAGVLQPDSGELLWDGRPVTLNAPDDAKQLGIETLYQDLGLINNLDIVANTFLGRELVNVWPLGLVHVLRSREMETETKRILSELKIEIGSVREKVEVLSGGQRQAVALGRAVGFGKQLILLDEPTAALGVRESLQALDLIRRMKDRGIASILISHNLEHVYAVADRIVVLRQGIVRGVATRADLDGDRVVSWITGSSEFRADPAPPSPDHRTNDDART
jgi:D-xylose transport system ATP-binding protein